MTHSDVKRIQSARFYFSPRKFRYRDELAICLKDQTFGSSLGSLHTNIHAHLVNSSHASCEILSPTENTSKLRLSGKILFIEDSHSIIIDESFIDNLRFMIFLTLPRDDVVTDEQVGKFVERCLFHTAVRLGRYRVLEKLPQTIEPANILGNTFFDGGMHLRTFVALQCIVSHESAHWAYASLAKELDIRNELPELRAFLAGEFDAALDRVGTIWRTRYSEGEAQSAISLVRACLETWLNERWEEVLCDFHGCVEAFKIAQHLKVPLPSIVVSIAVLYQLIAASTMPGSSTKQDDAAYAARSILIESLLNYFLNLMADDSTAEMAVNMRNRANRRFVARFATPFISQVHQLFGDGPDEPMKARRVRELLANHGYHPFTDDSIATVFADNGGQDKRDAESR